MAKFVKEFENGNIKNTLTFRGMNFTLTMVPHGSGSRSLEKCFESQLLEAFSDDENIEDILEDIDVDMLDTGDEDDIKDILEELGDIEWKSCLIKIIKIKERINKNGTKYK